MNNYARNYLRVRDSRSGRDGRNPYGSRGGYVDSRSGREYRDREDMRYDRNYRQDMRSGNDYRGRNDYAEYDSRQDYRDYAEYDMQRDYMDYEQHGQYNRDYADMRGGRGSYKPVEAMGYFSGYMGGQDHADYYDGHNKLSKKDIKKWEKSLENADGTRGKKYNVEQIEQVAKQNGIRFDEYSPEVFTMVVNMMYADYCKVLGSDMMIYVRLAKAFLEDDDFEGEPEEKVMLYYKCIVEKDD